MTAATPIMVSGLGVFNRNNHQYTWKGAPLISVTEAIGKSGLIDDTWFTEEARTRGRLVHMAVQFDAEGDLDESTVDPKIWPYVLAARKFRADAKLVPEKNETQIWAPEFGFAGTNDGHGISEGKWRVAWDYKTGIVSDWVRLQLAGYVPKLPGGATQLRWGVQLKPDASYKLTPFEPKTFRQDFQDFLACVRVRQLQLQHNKREGRTFGHSNGNTDE